VRAFRRYAGPPSISIIARHAPSNDVDVNAFDLQDSQSASINACACLGRAPRVRADLTGPRVLANDRLPEGFFATRTGLGESVF
jgi:hypothetical protein